MNLLLDTHTFLYFVNSSPLLSDFARNEIEDDANEIYLSIASAWEIAIKSSLNKLQIPKPVETFIPDHCGLMIFSFCRLKFTILGLLQNYRFITKTLLIGYLQHKHSHKNGQS